MKSKIIFYWLFFSLISGLFFACRTGQKEQRTVSVSILPQKYLVERIAGDYVHVNVMIPPGMNPASCDLSTTQLKQLYDSELCFTIGYLPFELTHLYPVLERQKDIRVINHSAHLDLLEGSCGHAHHEEHHHAAGRDPHTWLSPRYARIMADTILQVLSEKYPEQQEVFRQNYENLTTDIDRIARQAEQTLSSKKNLSFLIYHPALTYFAHDYGLEQISIEDEGKEPNPIHIKQIIDTAREKDIRIIFIQSQFDAGNAEAIAREIGGKVIPIDPLAADWVKEMDKLINVFK